MKYNAPFGSADPNAAYVDRNTPGAVKGSPVPAAAIELPQREIVTVITNAGLAPTNNDPTQLDQAIDLKIAAATGGAGDENYILMTQARVRLPIFPEVLTADGRLPVVSPSTGQVRVPAGYEFLHRGIFSVTTVQADFATAANKSYHLRWTPAQGFALRDLADAAYNPTAAGDGSAIFDSTHDDMLVARVVTNASNVPTVTNLVNKDRLKAQLVTALSFAAGVGNGSVANFSFSLNWARVPMPILTWDYKSFDQGTVSDWDEGFGSTLTVSRYGVSGTMTLDFADIANQLLRLTALN